MRICNSLGNGRFRVKLPVDFGRWRVIIGSSLAQRPPKLARINAMMLREDAVPRLLTWAHPSGWMLNRSDPNGSRSGLEEFEVHD